MRNQGRKKKIYNFFRKKHWTLASKCTSETRLRLLQWKILHNIYPSSILLNKMGISNSKNCAFGCNQTDYPDFFSFFFSCKKYQLYVEERVYRKFEIKLKLTVNDLLFGYKGHSQHFITPSPPHTHTKRKEE